MTQEEIDGLKVGDKIAYSHLEYGINKIELMLGNSLTFYLFDNFGIICHVYAEELKDQLWTKISHKKVMDLI